MKKGKGLLITSNILEIVFSLIVGAIFGLLFIFLFALAEGLGGEGSADSSDFNLIKIYFILIVVLFLIDSIVGLVLSTRKAETYYKNRFTFLGLGVFDVAVLVFILIKIGGDLLGDNEIWGFIVVALFGVVTILKLIGSILAITGYKQYRIEIANGGEVKKQTTISDVKVENGSASIDKKEEK